MPKFVVRHGVMRALGVCSAREGDNFGRGTKVIARTERGLEAGEILCEATEESLRQLQNPGQGQILRTMTSNDAMELERLHKQESGEYDVCHKHITDLKLEMQLVDVEHIFGGERIVVYYLAENRVDFRELVKATGRRVSNADRNAADRRARRGEAAGRLRRLRQAGLLQHASVRNAAGVDEDGQAAKGHARSDENLRPLRAAEMLPAL